MKTSDPRPAWRARGAFLCVAGLLLTVPFLFVETAAESFRGPKLWASDVWGLASLVFLAVGVRQVERLELSELGRIPALQATLPLLAVAVVSRFTTQYPLSVSRAVAELAIGAACLVGWSLGLRQDARDKLLTLLAGPAAALAILAVLQTSGLYRPFGMEGGEEASRMGVTSFAGNPGDLAAYLVLPCLLLQARLVESRGRRRLWVAAGLAVALAGLVATQTITALAALATGSLLFWLRRLPRRRAALGVAIAGALVVLLVLALPPLRARALGKVRAMAAGDWAQVLSYRQDGWRAAVWMFERHPTAGVGHGAYRSNYAAARLALTERGADFGGEYRQLSFFNAHNDVLEVAAELGWPGVLALAAALWTLGQALRRLPTPRRALAWAAVSSLAILALADFPFETALIAYPWLLFLSGILAPVETENIPPDPVAHVAATKSGSPRRPHRAAPRRRR